MGRRKRFSGALLRSMRKEADLTQEQLGERIGISRETVSAIENEKPQTMNTIEAEVLSSWHIVCRQRVSSDTSFEFVTNVMNYFGISEQSLINFTKKLTGPSDKR